MSTVSMGSLADLQKTLRVKDERIKELQKQLEDRDAQIQELKSELDKHISIMRQQGRNSIVQPNAPRRQRIGVTGDHVSIKDVKDVTSFKKYPKSQRSVEQFGTY